MSEEQINKLAQAAIKAKTEFEASRPGGFKHAFLYEAHRKAQRLFQKHATPEAWLELAPPGRK